MGNVRCADAIDGAKWYAEASLQTTSAMAVMLRSLATSSGLTLVSCLLKTSWRDVSIAD